MSGRDAASEAVFLHAQTDGLAFQKGPGRIKAAGHKRVGCAIKAGGGIDLAGAFVALKLGNCVDPGLGKRDAFRDSNQKDRQKEKAKHQNSAGAP